MTSLSCLHWCLWIRTWLCPGISVCPPVHCTSVLYPRLWMEKIVRAFGGYTNLRISLLFKSLGVALDAALQLVAMYPPPRLGTKNTPRLQTKPNRNPRSLRTAAEDNPTKGRAGRSWVALGGQPLQDKEMWPRFSEDLGTKSDGTITIPTILVFTGVHGSTSHSCDPGLMGAGLLS